MYGEFVQQVGARSVFGESVAFSDGREGTPFAGKCPGTNKGAPLSCITGTPTVMLMLNQHLLSTGEEELEKLVTSVPLAMKTLRRMKRSIGVSRLHAPAHAGEGGDGTAVERSTKFALKDMVKKSML